MIIAVLQFKCQNGSLMTDCARSRGNSTNKCDVTCVSLMKLELDTMGVLFGNGVNGKQWLEA